MVQVVLVECRKCKAEKPADQFPHYGRKGSGGYVCKACVRLSWREDEAAGLNLSTKATETADPRVIMWRSSVERALKAGIEHAISPDDIPTPNKCRYLQIELVYPGDPEKKGRWANNLASLDRIDSSKGYVPGNVQVISFAANRMKQDSSIRLLIQFARGVLREHA